MGFIDLHVHSTASDGSLSPAELVRYACEKGLSAFALTDHDTVSGIPGAVLEARSYPVAVIPGVEISCALGNKIIHLLGYNIEYENPGFRGALRILTHYRDERNIKICAQLRSYGVPIDYETFKNSLGCRMVTRNHFAEYLIRNGFAASREEAFEKYLAKGKPCYIPMRMLPAREAVRLILRARGIPVVAHPIQYRLSDNGYMQLFTLLRDFGVRGIEAIYPDNTYQEEQKFRSMAKELHMFVTGGTDYHGAMKPDIDLGTGRGNMMIPQSLLNEIR